MQHELLTSANLQIVRLFHVTNIVTLHVRVRLKCMYIQTCKLRVSGLKIHAVSYNSGISFLHLLNKPPSPFIEWAILIPGVLYL